MTERVSIGPDGKITPLSRPNGHGKTGQIKKASWLGKTITIGGVDLNQGSLIDFLNTQHGTKLKKGWFGIGRASNDEIIKVFHSKFPVSASPAPSPAPPPPSKPGTPKPSTTASPKPVSPVAGKAPGTETSKLRSLSESYKLLEQVSEINSGDVITSIDGQFDYGKISTDNFFIQRPNSKEFFYFRLANVNNSIKAYRHTDPTHSFETTDPKDLQLINDTIDAIRKLDRGTLITQPLVFSDVQEEWVTTYNWKKTYEKSLLTKMATFVQGAGQKAIIANHGILSNFQRIAFEDLIQKETVKSAEHLFQSLKFPPESEGRKAVLNAETPLAALLAARKLTLPGNQDLWNGCSLNLMVYIQLCKAYRPDTYLENYLRETMKAFLIEDTSATKEETWGDKGNGTGLNKLGLAQMLAREFIENNSPLTPEAIKEYYDECVKGALEKYYNSIPGYEQLKLG